MGRRALAPRDQGSKVSAQKDLVISSHEHVTLQSCGLSSEDFGFELALWALAPRVSDHNAEGFST